jgi:SAM-dependent methyltransferase
MRSFLYKIAKKNEHLNWGRDIVLSWSLEHIRKDINNEIKILDLGMAHGDDLINVGNESGIQFKNKNLKLHGVECYPPYLKAAIERGILGKSLNIEADRYPYKKETFNIIIANQVIEHTKEIFWIFSEISRICKPGGIVIVGVPNIAALHNRLMFLFGYQPKEIQVLGPHVRGFTIKGFEEFITCEGYFTLEKVCGSHLYLIPEKISKAIGKTFPGIANSVFFLAQRTAKSGVFGDILKNRFFETPYKV